MLARKALAGTAGAPKVYVEDVFSTYLYTGNGSTQTITNNIDLSGEGGMVWIKGRSGSAVYSHVLTDTARGVSRSLYSNLTNAAGYSSGLGLTAFNSNGFSLNDPTGTGMGVNEPSTNYVSWTFRKAKKFFDVVTYTGNGSNRTISHNLGSVPGSIFIKRTDTTGAWAVYHRSLANTEYLVLNTTAAKATGTTYWNSTTPTSTEFSLGTATDVNANSGTYVAYLFAHDTSADGIIQCGSYVGNGGELDVPLGFEPQFIMTKATTVASAWNMFDSMRGMSAPPNVPAGTSGSPTAYINANSGGAELTNNWAMAYPTANGFHVTNNGPNSNGQTYIYIAIRRGPMKTPTSGTSVFKPNTYTGTGADQTITGVGFAPDLIINKDRNAANTNLLWDRMRGPSKYLVTSNTAAEATWDIGFDSMDGFRLIGGGTGVNASGGSYVHWFLKRAPGFFDVVCYTGTGSATTFSHNLGVTPQLMIVKCRSTASTGWIVYDATNTATNFSRLDTTQATSAASTMWNNTSPTASVFSVGTHATVNNSGDTYVAYLFASVSGVSKVGSYTGNGSSVTVTTDFQPRFILVKRTDSTGNWIVSDSARGLVAGSDPYLEMNTADAEDTDEDWVDVSSTGFTVNETSAANANVNTGTYIYLAIA